MTIWRSMIYKKIAWPLAAKKAMNFNLSAWLRSVAQASSSFFQNIVASQKAYPSRYFVVTLSDSAIEACLISNKKLISELKVPLDFDRIHRIDDLFNKHAEVPIYLLIDTPEIQSRIVPLNDVKWWDRYPLVNQIQKGEFSTEQWLSTAYLSSASKNERFSIIGLNPTSSLKQFVNYLSRQPNPIVRTESSSITIMQQALLTAKSQDLEPWVIVLIKSSQQSWQLIVSDHEAVVLSRSGIIEEEQDFAKEISTTLRYLCRHGYQEGDKVSLLQIGMDLNLSPIEHVKTIKLPNPIYSFKLLPVSRLSLLKRFPCFPLISQSGLYIPKLLGQRLAFNMPRYFVKLFIPLTTLLIFSGFFLIFQNHFQQKYIGLMNNVLEALPRDLINEIEKNKTHQVLFKKFRELLNSQQNPLEIIQKLSTTITPEGVATELSWKQSDNEFSLTTFINLDNQLLEKKSLKAYKAKIKEGLSSAFPDIQLEWQKVKKQPVEILTLRANRVHN